MAIFILPHPSISTLPSFFILPRKSVYSQTRCAAAHDEREHDGEERPEFVRSQIRAHARTLKCCYQKEKRVKTYLRFIKDSSCVLTSAEIGSLKMSLDVCLCTTTSLHGASLWLHLSVYLLQRRSFAGFGREPDERLEAGVLRSDQNLSFGCSVLFTHIIRSEPSPLGRR